MGRITRGLGRPTRMLRESTQHLEGKGRDYQNLHPKLIDLGNVQGDITIDVSKAPEFRLKPLALTTVTFVGFPIAGRVAYWSVEIDGDMGNNVFFNNVVWDSNLPPSPTGTANQLVVAFRSRNSGAKIAGAVSFSNIA